MYAWLSEFWRKDCDILLCALLNRMCAGCFNILLDRLQALTTNWWDAAIADFL